MGWPFPGAPRPYANRKAKQPDAVAVAASATAQMVPCMPVGTDPVLIRAAVDALMIEATRDGEHDAHGSQGLYDELDEGSRVLSEEQGGRESCANGDCACERLGSGSYGGDGTDGDLERSVGPRAVLQRPGPQ